MPVPLSWDGLGLGNVSEKTEEEIGFGEQD